MGRQCNLGIKVASVHDVSAIHSPLHFLGQTILLLHIYVINME